MTLTDRRMNACRVVEPRCAYVFYATSDLHALAAIVFVRLLKRAGLRPGRDLLLLHLPVAEDVLDAAREEGMLGRRVDALEIANGGYYRHSLLKLRITQLVEYDTVVYADIDAIPLQPIDHLFDLEFSEPIAAPSAYWLPQPFWSTHLMVVHPSEGLWLRLARHFAAAPRTGWRDMDIVNHELSGEIATIPEGLTYLNSEWEHVERPRLAGFDPDGGAIIHFTALGKPWSYHPARARRLRPAALPQFHAQWQTWWSEYADVLRRCGWRTRTRAAAHRLHVRARDRARTIRTTLRKEPGRSMPQ